MQRNDHTHQSPGQPGPGNLPVISLIKGLEQQQPPTQQQPSRRQPVEPNNDYTSYDNDNMDIPTFLRKR